MSNWRYKDIKEDAVTRVNDTTKDWTPEQLRERISDLETAIYPFVAVLSCLDELAETTDRRHSCHVTSMLFPLMSENEDKVVVVEKVQNENVTAHISKVVEFKPEFLHMLNVVDIDSISLSPGDRLHDDFELINVHQNATAAYIHCGSITMGDVRNLESVLHNSNNPAVVKEES